MRCMNRSVPLPPPRGFTLIELMIVTVVIAVLASVAMPSFFESIRKSRRADAITSLSTVAQRQEAWRGNNPTYTANLGSTGLNVANPSSGYYTLAVSFPVGASSGVAYTVTATRAGGQTSDAKCGDFTLAASAGQFSYGTTGGSLPADRCWSR
jgi:type IV pilus assembly protein PilE